VIDRRLLLAGGLALAASPVLAQSGVGDASVAATGKLKARPLPLRTKAPLAPGIHTLGLDERDAWLVVPEGIQPNEPVPLIVNFHGKGERANETLGDWRRHAARAKALLLAPQSRGHTWEIPSMPLGADAQFVDRAIARVFEHFAVNPQKIAAAGFSDGGTMALSCGMVNGDFFAHVLAHAPIRFHAPNAVGLPKIFIANGERDPGAPYATARSLVRQLQGFGYDVEFYGFKGGHQIDQGAVRAAMKRFLES